MFNARIFKNVKMLNYKDRKLGLQYYSLCYFPENSVSLSFPTIDQHTTESLLTQLQRIFRLLRGLNPQPSDHMSNALNIEL
jgi:hypothetical protein